MIEFVVGIPRSGKTYRAVDTLYRTFIDDKSKLYNANTHFYTNINEFRFDLFPENVGFSLDFKEFSLKLSLLHHSAVALGFNDSQLIEQAKELNLFGALVVIDEAQNFFSKDDETLVWWLSYHGHLYQNIILLTQSLDLLHLKYKQFSGSFVRAVPPSLRLFGSVFSYKFYIGHQMFKKQETGVDSIKFNSKVYSLYHSGANEQTKKVIWKFFAFAGVAFLALVLVIYFVYRKWSPSEPEKNSTLSSAGNSQNNTTLSPASAPMLPPKTYEDIRLLCGSSMCVYRGVTLTNSDIDNLKRKYNFQLLSVTPFSPDFQIYIYRSKIGVSNEILAGTF